VAVDYIDQGARFELEEGIGCANAIAGGGFDILFIHSWQIVLPLVSTLFYCRELVFSMEPLYVLNVAAKIVYVFYGHSRETNEFLQSNGSVNRHRYFRIFALACVDILLTLPLGIINTTSLVIAATRSSSSSGVKFPFYYGWTLLHSDWDPVSIPYSELIDRGFWKIFQVYLTHWISPALAIVFFALFGLTSEARKSYWHGIYAFGKLFGWAPPMYKQSEMGKVEFAARQITLTEQYVVSPC
jgi:hypothetical protein